MSERESEPTRTGKIGQLPLEVRNELNRRIRAGELSPTLLPWLNEQAPVRSVLQRSFEDVDISPANLSDWRQGGYQDWLKRRRKIEETQEMAEWCHEMAKSGKSLLDGTSAALGGKLMSIVEDLDVDDQKALLADKPENIIGLMEGLAALQGQANRGHAIAQADRRLDLEERKFEGRFLKMFAKYYEDRRVQEIMQGKATKAVKMDQLALRIFGQRPELAPLEVA